MTRLQRILAVDDDETTRILIRSSLEAAGFEVTTASSAGAAIRSVQKEGLPDLALIDIRMPDTSGIELAQSLQSWSDLPVILVSAIDDLETIVRGLDEIAEDYVTKPFASEELAARVRRVLLRFEPKDTPRGPRVQIDADLEIDFSRRLVHFRGEERELSRVESKLLFILYREAPRIVRSSYLLQRIWPREDIFEDNLRVHVHRLRKKIEPVPRRPRYIVTERGKGYRMPLTKPAPKGEIAASTSGVSGA